MKSLSWVGVSTAVLALPLGGCDLVAGIGTYCEVGVDCPTSGTGGTGTGGATGGATGGGGSAGTAGTGGTGAGGTGTGGTGGGAFACVPAGAEFEVLGPADIPGATKTTGEFFLIPEPNTLPPKAHVVTRLDQQTGTLVVRTIKGVDVLGPVVTWPPPAGSSRYVDGYAVAGEVVVLGRLTGANGATVAEIHIAKDAENQIPASAQPQEMDLARPSDCTDVNATIDRVAFSRDGGTTHHMATWDECTAGVRRLYRSTGTGPQLVREGDKASAGLMLASYAHAGNTELALFSDGATSGYSSGDTVEQLALYKPVAFGSGATITAPLAAATVGANAFGVFWALVTPDTIAPATILGAVRASNQLATLDSPGVYTKEADYIDYAAVTRWSGLSVGATTIVAGGLNLDGSEARFSVMSTSGEALSMDNVVTTGDVASIDSVSAAHFGPKQVLVVWKKVNGAGYTVQGRVFACD